MSSLIHQTASKVQNSEGNTKYWSKPVVKLHPLFIHHRTTDRRAVAPSMPVQTDYILLQLKSFYGSLDFSGTIRVSRYQKGKTNLGLLEQEIVSGSGISWATCKSASRSRQTTTPVSHHSVFLQAGCPSCHPNNSISRLKKYKTVLEYLKWGSRSDRLFLTLSLTLTCDLQF